MTDSGGASTIGTIALTTTDRNDLPRFCESECLNGKCDPARPGNHQPLNPDKKDKREWTLEITSQDITESAGVTVTQGSITGVLVLQLTGATTVVIIRSIQTNIFITTENLKIGSTTVSSGNINKAENSVKPTIVRKISEFGKIGQYALAGECFDSPEQLPKAQYASS